MQIALSQQELSQCKRFGVDMKAYGRRKAQLMLSGGIRADPVVLKGLGIDLATEEVTAAELAVLTALEVSPVVLIDLKQRERPGSVMAF